MRRHRGHAALLTAALALAAAACGGGAAEPTDQGGWIAGLLGRIPDTADSGHEVMLADLAAAADVAGVAVPAPGAPADEVTDYLMGLPRDLMLPEIFQRGGMMVDEVRAEIGIDLAEVDATVVAGFPPEQFVALQGRFDPAAIDAAVRSDPTWSDLLATAEHGGVSYYTWGEDFTASPERRTVIRPLGRGHRLGLDDGYLYWVIWTAGIEGLIDAGAGTVPSLADDALLFQAAGILDAAGVYSAILTDQPLLAAPEDPGAGPAGYLAPYLVLGIGGGQDADGAFWVVTAIHSSEAAAGQSADGFRLAMAEGRMMVSGAPWSEAITGSEVTVQGTAMVAVVRSARPSGDWARAYMARDPLLAVAAG